jgi:hydrogenase-4 component F
MIIIFFIIAIVFSSLIFLLKNKSITKILCGVFLLFQIGLTVYAFLHPDSTDSVYYKYDALGILLSSVLSILSLATFYHSRLYLKRHLVSAKHESIYYAALMMLITSMMSANFAENITLLWVSIEATTLFVSLLIFHERSKEALEASWKYLFVSSVGVAVAFMGILFLSAIASKNGLDNLKISNLIPIAKNMNPIWIKIAFLLMLTGYSAKMGIFPLHTVTVDAHTVAPPPISAFISTTLMNVGFLGIYRVYTIIAQTEARHWAQNVLFIAGIFSITMSAVQLLRVRHFKRMYAFSSLEHMGIVALGLAVGGIGYYAAILHLIFHSFVKASLFYQIGQAHSLFRSYLIKDTGGYFKINQIGGLAVLLGFISITAIPPSGLFVSEFLTFKALFLGNRLFVAVLALLLLTVIIYVFGKNTLQLLYSEKPENIDVTGIKFNPYETITQFILLGLVVYLGINPPLFFTNLINSAIAVLS